MFLIDCSSHKNVPLQCRNPVLKPEDGIWALDSFRRGVAKKEKRSWFAGWTKCDQQKIEAKIKVQQQ